MKKIISLLLLILFTYSFSEEILLSPSDDMYTDPNHSGVTPNPTQLWMANFPSSGHFEQIMLKFDITPYLNKDLNSAILKLTRFFSCPSSGTTAMKFYAIDENWNESSWNHTQNITYNADISQAFVLSGPGGSSIKEFEIDITDFLNNWFSSKTENFGFVMIANNNQKFSKFYSKEFSNESYRPELKLNITENSISNDNIVKKVDLKSYPNPFNPSTEITFNMDKSQKVNLSIYNSNGKLIKNLINGFRNSGVNKIIWNANNQSKGAVNTGVYFAVLKLKNSISSKKLVLIK